MLLSGRKKIKGMLMLGNGKDEPNNKKGNR
jgi:hypothetical protein